jgi:gliding motility-associated-like protein
MAQGIPAGIGTDITGTYNDTILTQYGLFAQYRTYVTNPVASGGSKVEFPVAQGNFSTVWRAYTSGQVLLGFNQIIDTTQSASALYNSAFGGQGILLPAVTGGMFYTFNVQTHATGSTLNDTMGILQTLYNPVVIDSVSIPVDTNTINPACSPTVTATLSAPPSAGEYVYLRYSLTGFSDASFVIQMSVSGTLATTNIPPYPAGTHVEYYVLTSPIASLLTSGAASAYYDCQTLNLKNGSIGNNFRYTVKTLPVPSVSIAASANPVCQGVADVFTASGVNNGTVASDYQWYKNGIAVGTNDSVYSDATLNNNDSVWVVMTANLGCPVMDTSNHIIIAVTSSTPTSVSIVANQYNVCAGSGTFFTANPTGVGNGPTYQWYEDDTMVGTNSNQLTLSSFNNNDSVWVLMASDAICPSPLTDTSNHIIMTVTPNTYDSVYVIASELSYCNNVGMDTFIAVPIGGGPTPTYTWTIAEVPVTTGVSASGDTLITPPGNSLAGNWIQVTMQTSLACATQAQPASNPFYVSLYNNSTYTQNDTICQNGSFTENGHIYTTTNTYIDTFVNASVYGCDSIVTTNLYVYPLSTYTQYDTICQNGSFIENGHTYTTTNTYIDTFTNAGVNGCDSIVTTNLTVLPLATFTQNPSICQGGSFLENGHTYTTTNTYIDTFTNAGVNGCDSIVTTNLTVLPLASYTQNPIICQGSSFIENGHTYTATNTYMDTFTNAGANGCDSIVTTNLSVLPYATYTQNPSICQGSSFVENGHTYTTSNTYVDTFYNAAINGCDSIVTTILTVNLPATYTQNPSICQGSSFIENGHTYTTANTYIDTFTNASVNGCDSIVTTNLTVLPLATFTQNPNICQGGSFIENGHAYTTTNTYIDTFTNAGVNGCDSIVTTNLTVLPVATFTQNPSICQGGSFTENGHTYTTTNTYIDTFFNASVNGCDSVVTTNLTILPLATYTQNRVICQNGSFVENGHTYTTTNTYIDTFYNAAVNGCDSIVTTNLTVLPLATFTQNPAICQGQSFTENGHTYTTTNTYIDTFYNAAVNGCDSIVTTNLTVNPLPTNTIGTGPINQCGGNIVLDAGNTPGSTYLWSNGSNAEIDTFSSGGILSVTITNSFSCTDSFSRMAFINPSPAVYLGPAQNICGDSTILDAGDPGDSYVWTGGSTSQFLTVYSSSTYTVTVTDTASHCSASDSVQVTITALPYINLGNDTSLCSGPVILTAKNANSTYLWSNGNTSSMDTVTTTGNYSVTVTGPTGCTASGSVLITIYPKPNLGPDVTDSICPSSRADLYNYYINSGLTLTYSTATPASVDTGTYTVIGTNSNGCSDTALITIIYRQKPSAGGNKTDSICPGYTYDLTTLYPNVGYTSYIWNTSNPTAVDTGTYMLVVSNTSGCTDTAFATITQRLKPNLGGNKTDSICQGYTYNLNNLYPNRGSFTSYVWTGVVNDSAVGVGVYQLVVTNASGCTDTAYATIIQKVQPIVTIPAYSNLCSTNPPFTLTGATPVGGTYYVDYVLDSIFRTPILGPGIHHVLYIYTNASGCTDSASHDVTIYPQPQIIDTLNLPLTCTGSGLIDLNSYFSPAGGVFSGPGVSGIYFYPSLAPAGSDSLTYIYTDQNGCMDTAGRRIQIIPSVKVTLSTDQSNLTICAGQPITFIAGGATLYQFLVNDSAWTTVSTDDTFTTTGLANHDQVVVVGSNACSTDTSEFIIIDVIPTPTVTVGPDTTIVLGQTVQLYSNASGSSSLVYIWTPDSSLNLTNIPNPVYSGSDTIILQLKVTDISGCTAVAYDTINVIIPDNIILPNIITPNGDGYNDAWVLNPKINLAGSHLIIFDRWGDKVYETTNYANNWQGTYMNTGNKVPDGTYYYVLTVPAQNDHTYEGPINILSSKQ